MKLPRLDSTSTARSTQIYGGAANGAAYQGIGTSGIFDFISDIPIVGDLLGTGSCVLPKAGPKGVSCLAQCGPNPGCLDSCAGPTVVSAILGCI